MRAALAALLLALVPGHAAAKEVVLIQSTTSTQNAGLYEWILPQFEADTGIEARVVAVGTGQALKNATACDGDVVVVHAKERELAFVASGAGLERHPLMYNDFVLVGPADDPANAAGADAVAALAGIARAGAPFVSRGDDSGTHVRERALWAAAGLSPGAADIAWYRETGSGMGATLNIAAAMGAYVLTDRATWIRFANKAGLSILVEGDARLTNEYGIIAVNPAHCPRVRAANASAFVDWMLSDRGQAAIAAYRLDGQQLFFPGPAPAGK